MPRCNCGNSIPKKRAELGYDCCTDCGEAAAQQEIERKSKSVMPLHKSNMVYVPTKDYARDISRMRRG